MIVSRRWAGAAAAVSAVLLAGCGSTTAGTPDSTGPDNPAPRSAAPGSSASTPSSGDPSQQPTGSAATFTCGPGFVTTLRGYPVAAKVRHYPVPKLTPAPNGLAGRQGLAALRSGELDVVYSRESTGLAPGPSRRMYECFVRYVADRGWAPDVGQNKVYRRKHTERDPLLYSFYDSGSRYRSGNELTVRWFDSKANYGQGALLSILIEPKQYVPDLRPPPR